MVKEKCPWCPKEFQSHNDLDRHLRKIHGLKHADLIGTMKTEEEKNEFIEKSLEIFKEKKKISL